MCVYVRERKRDREREGEREKERDKERNTKVIDTDDLSRKCLYSPRLHRAPLNRQTQTCVTVSH